MATVNINNNYGNITVADTINYDRNQEIEEWIEQYYPSLMHSKDNGVRRWKQNAQEKDASLEAKIEELTKQVSMLVNLLATKEVIQ